MGSPAERGRVKNQRERMAWQNEAWGYFDALPEAKNGARFKGLSLAKLRLFPALQIGPDSDPIPFDQLQEMPDAPKVPPEVIAQCDDILERLAAGRGHDHLLDRWGRNSFVVGECYLLGYKDDVSPTGETFYMASPDELRITDKGGWALVLDPLDKPADWIPLPDDTSTMVRIWNMHARYGNLPDSSIRGVLDIAELMLAESNAALGEAFSRGNNGILVLPHSMVGHSRPEITPDGEPDAEIQEGEALRNPVVTDIYNQILTPIGNPRSPSVAAPYIMSADADDIDKIRHITFDRTRPEGSDERLMNLRERFAQGVFLPPEILLGFGDTTYTNSYIINDQTWTFYLQSDANQFVNALTTGLFRPLLLAGGVDANWVRQVCCWYDKSQLVAEPDEKDQTFQSVTLGLLGDTPARRRLGYSEAEAPTEEDIALRIQLNGKAPVDIVHDPAATDTAPAPQTDAPAAVTAAAGDPTRTVLDATARRWAKRDRALMDRLLAQADASLFRALDRAGAKLRTKAIKASASHAETLRGVANRDVAAMLGPGVITAALDMNVDDLLDGSWDELDARFHAQVGRAQAATVNDLRALGLDDEAADEMTAAQEQDRRRGALALTTGLTALATSRLFSPHPNTPALGEADSSMSVPVSAVRQALTAAGGNDRPNTPGGTARDAVTDRVSLGVTDGDTVAAYLAQLHISTSAWVWTYGDSERSFEPHLALDGTEFSAWTAPELANDESWPTWPFYFPGDHDGCCCGAEQVLSLDEAAGLMEPEALAAAG